MYKYVVYQDNKGEFRATFYAKNGEALFSTTEGYKDARDCREAVKIMQNFGGQAHAIVEEREQSVEPVQVSVEVEKPKRKRTTKRK